ncbi:hypothetical protein FG386_003322 [Cryptosporidium ryanae]|uniref:uncharacterized protein n=1 Tax=Cryptosporidium ryanae TaxID=515981 RepID=UPI00351A0CCC|nr:hypothetical protein FG386_003322 [Cryptosporidium ryanae]
MSINNTSEILNNATKGCDEGIMEASLSPKNRVSPDLVKISSQTIPDSPTTIFTSVNSSPNQNICEKEDSNINQFYSLFSRASDEITSKELQSSYYPFNYSTLFQNFNQLLPPSSTNNKGASRSNEINSVNIISKDNNVNYNNKINLPASGIYNRNNYQGEISGLGDINTNNGGFSMTDDNNSLRNGVDASTLYNQYLNLQIDWNNCSLSLPYNLNLYYQQLALYNRMLMSMYLPIFGNGYNNNINPYLSQLISSSFNQSNTLPSTYSQSCVNMGQYSDIQANQFPKMISLENLSQLYQNYNSSVIGNNIGVCNGLDSNVNMISGHLPTSNSPINSTHSLASLLSPINTGQSNTSRSLFLNRADNSYDLSSTGVWGSTQNDLLESSINQNIMSNYSKLSSNIKSLGRKTERTRKYTKNNSSSHNSSNVGARRKIDKNSAVCIVCGTTQTSQWRFLNLGELHSSNYNNKAENSSPKLEESHEADEYDSSEHIGSSTSNDNHNNASTIVDKQICCNACYMKYDKNRPRYRNGKKVPPPLPTYLYTHGQITNKSNIVESIDNNHHSIDNNDTLKNELISIDVVHNN